MIQCESNIVCENYLTIYAERSCRRRKRSMCKKFKMYYWSILSLYGCVTADLRNKKLLLAELQCFNTDSPLCDNYSLVDQKYHHLRLETAKKLKVRNPLPLPSSHCNQDKENSLRKSAIFLLHSLSWYLRVYCTALEPCFIFRLQITGPFATMSKMSKQRRLVENHRLS